MQVVVAVQKKNKKKASSAASNKNSMPKCLTVVAPEMNSCNNENNENNNGLNNDIEAWEILELGGHVNNGIQTFYFLENHGYLILHSFNKELIGYDLKRLDEIITHKMEALAQRRTELLESEKMLETVAGKNNDAKKNDTAAKKDAKKKK